MENRRVIIGILPCVVITPPLAWPSGAVSTPSRIVCEVENSNKRVSKYRSQRTRAVIRVESEEDCS